MRDRLWIAFGLLLGVSFAIQVAMPVDLSESPETTYETAPRGHAALFELLSRFDAVEGRWLSGLTMPPVGDTIWWIAAPTVCDGAGRIGSGGSTSDELDSPFRFGVEGWIEAGGTAVVWLSRPPLPGEDAEAEGLDRRDDSDPEAPETREVAYRRIQPAHRSDRTDPLASPRDSALQDFTGDTQRAAERELEPDSDLDGSDGDSEPEDEADPEAIREGWQDSIDDTRSHFREGASRRCRSIAGHALPRRRLAGLVEGVYPEEGTADATVFVVGRSAESRETFDYSSVRMLPGTTLAFFETDDSVGTDGWRPLWVEANDFSPFALERSVGEGRLIVVADARVLSNGRLAKGDSAPFVFDWIRDRGIPWIDEHHHGVVAESGTFRYLATSPASAACIGLLALGGLFIWRGNALPKRRVVEVDPNAPTLSAFVESLARLYSGTSDYGRAFERYRALSLERVRRTLGLAPGTPAEIVLASLRARADNRPALQERGIRDLLTEDLRVSTLAEFERAAARLDELVRILKRENAQAATVRRGEM